MFKESGPQISSTTQEAVEEKVYALQDETLKNYLLMQLSNAVSLFRASGETAEAREELNKALEEIQELASAVEITDVEEPESMVA